MTGNYIQGCEQDDTPAAAKVLNKSMVGLFSVMNGIAPVGLKLSHNGNALENIIRQVDKIN